MSNHPRRKAMSRSLTAVAIGAVTLSLLACTSAGGSAGPSSSPAPSGAPSAPPSAAPAAGGIDHPTGATDVILRYDEGGGFVMASYAATMLPPFTLYGDGTIVFRDPTLEIPPMEGSIGKANPMRIAKLTEEQIQEVLKLALDDGGLAVARPEYTNDQIADAGTAIFTVNADGQTKTVSVYALGIDPSMAGADAPARLAFAKLAESLTSIEKGGAITATDYAPTAYRGILMEAPGVTDPGVKAWPWTDLEPADFVPAADANGLQFPHHTLTPAQVEALGETGFEGGLQNVTLTGPDGKTYTLSVRPLLPDETE